MIDPREELKAYLDGELDSEASNLVREQLALDPDLAREAEQYRAISASLAHEWQYEPVGLDETIAALRRKRPRRFWLLDPRLTVPLTVGCVCVAIGFYLFGAQPRAGNNFARTARYEWKKSIAAAPAAALENGAMSKPQAPASSKTAFFGSVRTAAGAPPAATGNVIIVRDRAEALNKLSELQKQNGNVVTRLPSAVDNEIPYLLTNNSNSAGRLNDETIKNKGVQQGALLNSNVGILRWPKSAPAASMAGTPKR